MRLQECDIRSQPSAAVGGSMRQWNLAAPKTHALCLSGEGASAIEGEVVFGPPSDQLVDGLAAQFGDEIPQREINDADGGERQSLSPVEQAGAKELVPYPVDVAWIGADQKAAEMLRVELFSPSAGIFP